MHSYRSIKDLHTLKGDSVSNATHESSMSHRGPRQTLATDPTQLAIELIR